jgi:hypothetical protein
MSKFRYHGPLSSVTIGEQDVMLFPEKEVELPEDNEYVATLVAMKRLEPIVVPTPEPVSKTDKVKG